MKTVRLLFIALGLMSVVFYSCNSSSAAEPLSIVGSWENTSRTDVKDTTGTTIGWYNTNLQVKFFNDSKMFETTYKSDFHDIPRDDSVYSGWYFYKTEGNKILYCPTIDGTYTEYALFKFSGKNTLILTIGGKDKTFDRQSN